MKFEAHLEVINPLASKKGYRKSMSILCQISLAKDPNSSKCYLIVNDNKKPSPDKYRISDNVDKIYCKFVHEGKASIVLKEPNFTLAIQKANVNQLKVFLKIVHIATTSNDFSQELDKIKSKLQAESSCPGRCIKPLVKEMPSTTPQFKKTITSLVIKSRDEYLSNYRAIISQNMMIKTSISTIPTLNLLKLVINNCGLKTIDTSVFEFTQLNHLDMSNNKLSILDNFKLGTLVELNLSQNQITNIGHNIYVPKLINLDLSHNQLEYLDQNFCINFRSVAKLRINNNKIRAVSNKFGDYMQHLKYLYANNNHLVNLPFSFSHLRMDTIELNDNPFEFLIFSNNKTDKNEASFPSLVELCARNVVNKKIKYGLGDIPKTLIDFLDTHIDCVCGLSCFNYNFRLTVMFDLNRIAKSFSYITINGVSDNQLPLKVYLCSCKCYMKYSKFRSV
ncbi:unnamed protein product [Brachionus calyciflorus]|uniref:PIF1/LRR1 pleckstrin homology domain-containing protein n=1 Tax=Brachionus calyciflorus TaxID=104777 RepID=A0A813MMN3_9BILA|nr:unnamed protein product [Brachionus calyciflorus]